jgi:HSP20 family protein
MARMLEDMDRVFDDFGFGRSGPMRRPMLDPSGGRQGAARTMWSPRIEVTERDGKLVVCADLPGLRKEDVKVDVSGDALVIQGERREQQERPGYSERSYGSFYRSIPLPEGINPEQAEARFEDGVLEVSLPMPEREQQQRKRLEIR